MKIKVKYFADIEPLAFIKNGDWVDVRAAETVVLTGAPQLIPLGFALELPPGYEAHLVPRSSTFKKYGVIQTNGMGVVDESYSGDNDQWYFPCIQVYPMSACIHKNARIAQFRIIKKQPVFEFEPVTSLGNSDRGGLGSTGEF